MENKLKKIESFQVDHTKMCRGIFVSRKDYVNGNCVTTFDIRMKVPNKEPVLDVPALHAFEHLGATYLRSDSELSEKTIYFGPMGCRTGFYLILKGDLSSSDVVEIISDLYKFAGEFSGEIPGQSTVECGNYLDMNLNMANYECKKFYEEVLLNLEDKNLNYP